jgi:hypothetical protein
MLEAQAGATYLTTCPVEFKSLAICGIEGTKIPDTNTLAKKKLYTFRGSFRRYHIRGRSPLHETRKTIVVFLDLEKRSYTEFESESSAVFSETTVMAPIR